MKTEAKHELREQEKHSALPWTVGVRQRLGGMSYVAIGDATDYVAARTSTDADASFVVRAVNNHDALIEALEFALRESGCDGDLCNYRWHEKARAALAAAQE